MIIPSTLHPVPPVERDIEERAPRPASTDNPLDQIENEVIQRRDKRAERGRRTELSRFNLLDEFRLPPRREIVQEPMERINLIVPVANTEIEDLPGTQQYPRDLPSTPQNPPLVEARSEEETEPPEPVEFPGEAENNEWEEWDEYPLGVGQSGDEQPPEPRPPVREET